MRAPKRRLALAAACSLLACGLAGCYSPQGSTYGSGQGGASAPLTPCSPASDPAGPFCLRFEGTQFDIHVGELFKVALVTADGSNTVVAGGSITALPAPAFSYNLPQAMAPNVPYYVDYFVDHNGNKTCDPPPTDHVWRSHLYIDFYNGTITTAMATTGDVTWSQVHDDPWVTDPVGMNTCAQINQVP